MHFTTIAASEDGSAFVIPVFFHNKSYVAHLCVVFNATCNNKLILTFIIGIG